MRMKYLLLILMVLLLLSGCNKDKEKVETPVETESVEIENTKEEAELEEEEPLDTSPTEEEQKENSSEQTENPDTKSEEKTENSTPVVENTTQENTSNSHKEEKPPKENVEVSKPIVHYNPNTIVQLATNKLKAIGKVTLTDNLDRLLAEGSITQEEYNEYYPYCCSSNYFTASCCTLFTTIFKIISNATSHYSSPIMYIKYCYPKTKHII